MDNLDFISEIAGFFGVYRWYGYKGKEMSTEDKMIVYKKETNSQMRRSLLPILFTVRKRF